MAAATGIKTVYSQQLPEEKLQIIEKLQAESPAVMVGDGINDAPALTQADVGVVMGKGSDIAIEAGDMVLIKNSRLSVQPVTYQQWAIICEMAGV